MLTFIVSYVHYLGKGKLREKWLQPTFLLHFFSCTDSCHNKNS